MAKKKHKEELAELKQPDQFVSFWSRMGERAARHRRALVTVVVTVLAGTAALQASRHVFGKRDADTSLAFARIERVARAPLLPKEGEPPKFEDGLPHFKTDAERKQAALKEAESFLATHPKGKLAAMAGLMKADYLRDLQRHEEALGLYETLSQNEDLTPDLRLIALDGLALTQESLGRLDAAMASLDRLVATSKERGGFMGDRATYHKARLLESQGKAADALRLYKAISAEYPDTTLREEVTRRLALLEEEDTAKAGGTATP